MNCVCVLQGATASLQTLLKRNNEVSGLLIQTQTDTLVLLHHFSYITQDF